jgi:Zn-dependent protease
LILSLGVHEAAHAFVAWRCGDSTARDLGRMTLDPLPHIDPFMTVLLPAILWFGSGGAMMFGGAKPVPVDYNRLRKPARDMMLVALAGPISNFLLAIVFFLVFKLLVFKAGFAGQDIAALVMYRSMQWNCLLAAFNMIPIPPLDGSRVMSYLLPRPLRESYNRLEHLGMLLVLGLMFTGLLRFMYLPVMDALTNWANFLTGGFWA